jgi:putative ABC transport system ATP-binding protein
MGRARQECFSSDMSLIRTNALNRTYIMGEEEVVALNGVSLTIEAGEFVAVMGPSGSGKSTFMNLIGALDKPNSGDYHLDNLPVSTMDADALAGVRNKKIGFVFQQFNLLERHSALTNVALPLIYAGVKPAERVTQAKAALTRVGLDKRMLHRPTELSGGQQQRVAIARAIVNRPKILLADEPTGALDSKTALEVMALFQELNTEGMTILIVTHEAEVAAFATRLIRFKDGVVLSDAAQTPLNAAQELEKLK